MKKIREQGGTSCKLFWTDLRGKRKEGEKGGRVEDDEGRMWREKMKCWK